MLELFLVCAVGPIREADPVPSAEPGILAEVLGVALLM